MSVSGSFLDISRQRMKNFNFTCAPRALQPIQAHISTQAAFIIKTTASMHAPADR